MCIVYTAKVAEPGKRINLNIRTVSQGDRSNVLGPGDGSGLAGSEPRLLFLDRSNAQVTVTLESRQENGARGKSNTLSILLPNCLTDKHNRPRCLPHPRRPLTPALSSSCAHKLDVRSTYCTVLCTPFWLSNNKFDLHAIAILSSSPSGQCHHTPLPSPCIRPKALSWLPRSLLGLILTHTPPPWSVSFLLPAMWEGGVWSTPVWCVSKAQRP